MIDTGCWLGVWWMWKLSSNAILLHCLLEIRDRKELLRILNHKEIEEIYIIIRNNYFKGFH